MEVILPLLMIGTIGVITIALLAQTVPRDESQWLLQVLLLALALRLAAATMFVVVPATRVFHEDAVGYEHLGMVIAAGWKGHGPPLRLAADLSQNYGYYYLCAGLYYVFGGFRVVPSYWNSLFGTVTVLLVYRLAREFFHVAVARRAALLVAFIPSMILWSAMALKDTVMTTLIVISLLSCVRLKRRFGFWALFGTVAPIIAIQPIRFYIVYFVGFAVFLSLFLERGVRALSGVSKQLMVFVVIALMIAGVGLSGRLESGIEGVSFERISSFRSGMSTTAQSGLGEVDISTPARALAFLPLGVMFLLLSPFPWQFTSFRSALTLPEMLVWWAMVPALIRGVRFAVRTRFASVSPLVLFAVTLTLAYSLMHGNIGAAFRQRAQIFVFLFIFAALGQYVATARKRGLDPGLLLQSVHGGGGEPPPDVINSR